MDTAGKAFEALQAGKKAIKQGRELHGRVQEGYGRAGEVHGKTMEIKQQAEKFGITLPKDASSLPKNRAEFQKEAKGYARGCFCGFWEIFKAETKKYITYVLSLLVFAFIAIGLVSFLIAVLSHHPHLQLFTLTTRAMTSNNTKGDLVAMDGESVDYKIYPLHYCVSGLTTKAEEQFKMTNGCHPSKQATLLATAVLQTLLAYHTIHILKHDINLSTSSLDITLKTGILYIILAHFFWCTLLFNLILFRLIDWLRNRRKTRKLRQTQDNYQAHNIKAFDESAHDGHYVAGVTWGKRDLVMYN
ncbi:predicted protein [Sclerotinia sclerotiorum 1980 UF-70]|uniref:Uncharacterized protein n=1 Tax=Sclerotinia sclerotiorum (strain ATCC 18683 / 1980 / Ss-1) TaxID=665079 RepID=A7ELH1_SCLS1|nr:predicted protein [Sclerotinia sclerotiorum 1980 UF-70]EDO03687.1 predicted protein [Sclerotinia sclerotiorum 1980 UF-70]